MTGAEKTFAQVLILLEGWVEDAADEVHAAHALIAFDRALVRGGVWRGEDRELTPRAVALIARYREHLATLEAAQLCTCGEARADHANGGGCGSFRAAS